MKTAQEKWKRIYRCVNGPMKYYTYSRMEMLDLRYTAALERALDAANRRAERAEARVNELSGMITAFIEPEVWTDKKSNWFDNPPR